MKGFAKFTFRLFVLFFLMLVATVLYLDLKGFPPRLKELVERQFLPAGYAVQFGSIRLDVLRGVVARDALVADAKARNHLLARIDEVQLEWNWRRMMHRHNAVNALRIANATISVPTPPDDVGPETFTAQEAYATFRFLDDGTTTIDQLSGVYCGIRVQVSGTVKPRGAASPEAARRAGEKSPFVFVTKALRELNRLKVSQPPQLDLNFDIDLGQPMNSRVHARLIGTDFGYRKLQIQRATVDVTMREGAIDIAECKVQIAGGDLSVRGQYDVGMGRFDLQLSSTLDPTLVATAVLPEEMVRALRDVRVEENPKIEARYVLSPETGSLPKLQGTVQTGKLDVRGVQFNSISFAFENQGPDVKIANAKILMAEGQLTGRGQIQIESSDFSYEIDSTLDPRKLLPLMTPVMRQVVEPSWFETPPHIVATVSGDFVDPDAFAYDAVLTTRRCSYRGVALVNANANMQLRHSRLRASEMVIARDEGIVRGSLLADFNNHQISFDIQTTANPSEMAPLLGPKAADVMRAYRFGPRTSATARGLVDLDVSGNSAWSANVSNDGFSYWKLAADHAIATLNVTNNFLRIDDFESDMYGGKVSGRAEFSLTNAPNYQFDFKTEQCDVHRLLMAISGKSNQVSGAMSGHCALEGQGSDVGTIRGRGNLTVTEGILWEMPLFGIFSHIMDGLSPGLGQTKATEAKATFTIEDRCAKTEDLKVAAGAFTLVSHGKVCFDGKLDFRVNAQFMRAVPLINLPWLVLGKILEYKIGGTIGDYTYRPVNLPKELLPHSADTPKKENAD